MVNSLISTPFVNSDRLAQSIERGAQIGRIPKGGVRRIAYSPEEACARNLVQHWMIEAEMSVRIDTSGNIIGRYSGKFPQAPALATGSHIDTVPNGAPTQRVSRRRFVFGMTEREMSETSWALTITTERLILRPQYPSDYESWYAGFSDRLPKQHKYDDGQVDLTDCDFSWFSNLCQRHQELALSDQVYVFGVFSRKTHQHFGNIDLSTIRREENQWANLGYSIHNQYWRQGFGREAVQAALNAGFENLGYHRIEAAINLDNQPSIALVRRVGLKEECIRRGFFYEDGKWVDHFIYAAIPSDLGLEEKPLKKST